VLDEEGNPLGFVKTPDWAGLEDMVPIAKVNPPTGDREMSILYTGGAIIALSALSVWYRLRNRKKDEEM